MKETILILPVVAGLSILVGCHKQPPNDAVCLVDTSRSIDPQGIQYEFSLLDTLVDRMQRGDSLTVIPITGNALNDTPGKVFSFTAPLAREPYDHDLVVMRQSAHQRIDAMRSATIKEPTERTDILGALDAAKQEFGKDPEGDGRPTRGKSLIVLSDFIEDDERLNFMSDRRLNSLDSARTLAKSVTKERACGMEGVRIRLLSVESSDRRILSQQRQRSISEFWKSCFSPTNPNTEIQMDGTNF
jgi:hypothetical protein